MFSEETMKKMDYQVKSEELAKEYLFLKQYEGVQTEKEKEETYEREDIT